MITVDGPGTNRRRFLFAGVAAAMGSVLQTASLETFTQWLNASRQAREAALQPCLDRIRSMDGSIRAWVQVLPQQPQGDGVLSAIPFGAKDIIETRGLSTEYGSPIYRGRIGTADAAIVRELRQRERDVDEVLVGVPALAHALHVELEHRGRQASAVEDTHVPRLYAGFCGLPPCALLCLPSWRLARSTR